MGSVFVGFILLLAFLFALRSDRCPKCGKFFTMQEMERIVLREGTDLYDGKARVTLSCKHCDFTLTRDETIRSTYYPWEFM